MKILQINFKSRISTEEATQQVHSDRRNSRIGDNANNLLDGDVDKFTASLGDSATSWRSFP